MQEFWVKQTDKTPLFEDILWSRPENRLGAGKLLIIGGNAHSFAAVGLAYEAAMSTGAGTVHTLLPDALRKTVGTLLPGTDFAGSTPSGSFARTAVGEAVAHSSWADGVLLAGDFGRNSETSIMLEQFATKYTGQLTITKDAVDYFTPTPDLLLNREDTALVLSLSQLQKLGISAKFTQPFLLSMGMVLLVQALHEFSLLYPVIIVTKELDNIVVAYRGRVSSTKIKPDQEVWRVRAAAKAATFWMQNPSKPFEGISTSFCA